MNTGRYHNTKFEGGSGSAVKPRKRRTFVTDRNDKEVVIQKDLKYCISCRKHTWSHLSSDCKKKGSLKAPEEQQRTSSLPDYRIDSLPSIELLPSKPPSDLSVSEPVLVHETDVDPPANAL